MRRTEHDLLQAANHGGDLGGSVADPECQRGAVDLHALARHDLRLAIERLMIGKAADHDIGDHRLGRQAALDQARRHGLLYYDVRATAAGEFWPPCDQHPVLRRDYVEPLGAVLADLNHRRVAAWARCVVWRQHDFDTWEVLRQRTAAGAPPFRLLAPQGRIAVFDFGRALRDRGLDILKTEGELFLRQPLGFPTELHPLQLQQQCLKPLAVGGERVALRYGRVPLHDSRIAFRHHRQHQRPQCRGFGRQITGCWRSGARHAPILSGNARRGNRFCRLHARPVEAVEQRRILDR